MRACLLVFPRLVAGFRSVLCDQPFYAGGKTGYAVSIIQGTSIGQWRRVVGITGGAKGQTITLDAPFESPPVVGQSTLQIGQMRGQVSVVGNHFVKGGAMQLYAACYDCVVAHNRFDEFGFSNWGRNPHGIGWQQNLNNLMVDNIMNLGQRRYGCPRLWHLMQRQLRLSHRPRQQ